MAQGNTVLSNDTNCIVQDIILKDNQVLTTEVLAGEVVNMGEGGANVRNVAVNADGQLMITLGNGGMLIVKNYADFKNMDPQPVLQLPNGQRVAFVDLPQMQFADASNQNGCDPTQDDASAAVTTEEKQVGAQQQEQKEAQQQDTQTQSKHDAVPHAGEKHAQNNAQDAAQKLAQIEPAAGDAGGGAASAGGFGFQSNFSQAALQSLGAVGVIDPTALNYGAPDVQQQVFGFQDVGTPGLAFTNSLVSEDGSVQMNLQTFPAGPGDSLTITVTGFLPGWGVDTSASGGTYNAATGTWTITLAPGQSFNGGPLLSPPANSDGDMLNLHITTTATNIVSGNTATSTGDVNVYTDAVADAPGITENNASGTEDTPIPLNIGVALTDTDGSEEITNITISGVPEGASLNQGVEISPGVWQLTMAQLSGLTITPPHNFSGTFNLNVSATSTETRLSGQESNFGNNSATTTTVIAVNVEAVVDEPKLKVEDMYVKEDGAVQMNIHAALTDTDGSESLTIMITGIGPDWTVNFPTDQYEVSFDFTNGAWIIKLPPGVTSFDGGPILTPPPNSDVDLTKIKVTAVSTEQSNGATASTSVETKVIVDAVADAPELKVAAAAGKEDESVALKIETAVTDTDGSEKIVEIIISGVPEGFDLSGGKYMGGGVWVLQPSELKDLKLIPPQHWSGTLDLKVTSVSAETSLNGGERDYSDNTASSTANLTVTIYPQPDMPVLKIEDSCIKEDGSGQLNIYAAPGDATESLTITVTGINPAWGVDTSQSGGTYNAATGTWTITLAPGQSFTGGPVFSPPANSDADMNNLRVSVTSTDPTGSSVTASGMVNVIVDAVVDAPKLEAKDIEGREDQPLEVNISAAVTDTDGSEEISVVLIKGLPDGFSLSAGEYVGNGVWAIKPDQLSGLKLYPPANWSGDLQLRVTAVATEANLSGKEHDYSDNTASTSTTINLHVAPSADAPSLRVEDVCIKEDGSGQLSINATPGASNESLTITVTGIGPGWGVDTSQSGGTYNAATGTWTITLAPGQSFTGGPVFSPPANSDVDLNNLHVTATSTASNGSSASASAMFNAYVDAVVDAPNLTVSSGNGEEGGPAALNIATSVNDTDGSEIISSIKIAGVPDGFVLSAGTNLGNGVWVLTPAQLAGLTLTPPANWSGTLQLSVSSTATEANLSGREHDTSDNQMTVNATMSVTFTNTADPPNLCVGDVYVKEDGSAQLQVSASLNDPRESLTVTITGINPAWGVDTSQSGGTYNAATGTWTITLPPGHNFAGGPVFSPPANSDADMTGLHVTATSGTPGGASATVNATANVYTDAVIDVPYLHTPGATGSEDQPVALNISAGVTDTDGSESITGAMIRGVPDGFTLVPGTNLGNGVWSINPAQLSQVSLVPPNNWSGNLTLSVTVTATETRLGGAEFDTTDNQMSVTSTLNVSVAPVPDMPDLGLCFADTCVGEDGLTAVDISASLRDMDGSETLTVTISGITPGWDVNTSLSGGVFNAAAGTWTITLPPGVTSFAGGPIFIPPHNSDVDLTGLRVTATATERDGSTISRSGTMNIYVDAIADAPSLSAQGDTGHGGEPLDLSIATAVTDTDGSESITRITVSGVPNGVSLSAGINLGNGMWELTAAQLVNLKVLTPPTYMGDFTLQISSTSTETNTSGYEATTANNSATTTTFVDFHVTCGAPTPPRLDVATEQTTATVNVENFAHVFSTDVVFPSVREGQVFDHPEAKGVQAGDLSVDRDTTAQVSWVSEGAGYNNSLGYYVVDAAGQITGVKFIFENSSANLAGVTVPMAVDVAGPGSSLGFFIVADGFSVNGGYAGLDLVNGQLSFVYNLGQADQRTATVNDAGGNISLIYTAANGQQTTLSGPVYHTTERGDDGSINPDGAVHAASGLANAGDPNVLRISFEDLPNLGDRDFEDIVFDLRISPSSERTLDPVTLSTTVDINDIDSVAMSGARIDFTSGYHAGDQLVLTGGYMVDGDGSVLLNGADTGIVLSADPVSHALGFTGLASITAYEGLLSSVAFSSTATDVAAGARVFTYAVTDATGLTSNLDQVTVTVRDPAPLPLMAGEQSDAAFSVTADDVAFAATFTGADHAVMADYSSVASMSSKYDDAVDHKIISMASVLAPVDPLAETLSLYANDDVASKAGADVKAAGVHSLYATLVTDVVDLTVDQYLKNGNSVA